MTVLQGVYISKLEGTDKVKAIPTLHFIKEHFCIKLSDCNIS